MGRTTWGALVVALGISSGACAPAASAGPPGTAIVREVIDGDTVEVSIGGRSETVRLIGIDTPETKHPTVDEECFGAEASAALASLLPPHTEVELTRDVEARDRYGRLLAYVVRASDGLLVNVAMAEGGFADASEFPPNLAHATDVAAAVTRARTAGSGLWTACGGPDVPVDGAR